ncbi:hypothetical protein [Candidatus Mycoplasma haematohominis]|uniref:hypothetical protein n=1 Tax=Candidatus Mycoplasma haematohominis TaxID=1494318 RepID=UPI001C0A6828|nr:hypothetical protein [Candidatus Mycoplasma haemohominis]
MNTPKKPEFKSAKAQKIILELEELFDPDLFDFKTSRYIERFHGKFVVKGNGCDIPLVKKGFMPFAFFCKKEIRWGSRLVYLESPPHLKEFIGVYVVCYVGGWIWSEKKIEDVFKTGNTVDLIGGWGRFIEWKKKMPGRFFAFAVMSVL